MNIPDKDPKAVLLYCSKCGNPTAFGIVLWPGTLIAAVCGSCLGKLLQEEKAAEAKEQP